MLLYPQVEWARDSLILSSRVKGVLCFNGTVIALAAISIRIVAPKKVGAWECGFTDARSTMEDLVTKLQQRIKTTP
jgi:hypothetical protein